MYGFQVSANFGANVNTTIKDRAEMRGPFLMPKLEKEESQ